MMAPRVFVPQWPIVRTRSGERVRRDLEPARAFGEIVELLTEEEATGVVEPGEIAAKLGERLRDFSDGDFMILCGNPTAMVVAATVAMELNEGRARFLQWRNGAYAEWAIGQDFWDHISAY